MTCMICGKPIDSSNHKKTYRHVLAVARLSVGIADNLDHCPFCCAKPLAKCRNAEHAKQLVDCRKLVDSTPPAEGLKTEAQTIPGRITW